MKQNCTPGVQAVEQYYLAHCEVRRTGAIAPTSFWYGEAASDVEAACRAAGAKAAALMIREAKTANFMVKQTMWALGSLRVAILHVQKVQLRCHKPVRTSTINQ